MTMEWTSLSCILDSAVTFPVLALCGVLLALHLLKRAIFPVVFPWIMDRMSRKYNKGALRFKRELFKDIGQFPKKLTDMTDKDASVIILEIGVGSGANFAFYPDGSVVIGVEPNRHFAAFLERNVAKHSPRVRLQRTVVAYAENLHGYVDDCSVDAVVVTLVLCSVKDVGAILSEVKRVLKPGGKLYFLEHVAADPSTWTSTLQWFISPVWSYFGDGCRLMNRPWLHIEQAGFSEFHCKKFWVGAKYPLPIRPHVMGIATK